MPKKTSPWHWQPLEPEQHNPIFRLPWSVKKITNWYRQAWQPRSEYGLFIILALLSWWMIHPLMSADSFLGWESVALIYLKNLVFMISLAGGLHAYFYVYKKQREKLRYDTREQRSGSRFTFGSQVFDNMFWTLASGVTIWTLYEVGVLAFLHMRPAHQISLTSHPVGFVLLLLLIPIWISFHFYCVHRLLHTPFLYRWVHSLHHRNQNTIPWSGLSMHPVEHLVYLSSVLIHLVVPSHPIHLFFHLYGLTLSPIFGHTGYHALIIKGKEWMAIGHFHHQLHHRYFEVNYGAVEMPCDEWFNTFDDGTPEARQTLRHRRVNS
ncbi:MAG: sterol desaturase family protein [Pseudomonadota bacterium]